ncbi:TPA: hypothetical protein ACK3Q6_002654 [Burkholderia cepacia]|uniref:Uncharacterized protein n=1 Tax=Burkholderia cenocepacia TaxID=95486 RepID=A0ABD4UCH1_9BURK|nr:MULTISPECIES: hypothetical protein [Burkholderia]HDR9764232.1 hypothetical protein [Burkholderia cepacia ATCC 25416]KVV20859.1 hypothetical protein WK78_26480 [Burkholderia cepacia]MCA8361237.1 hypothetical protein [Burkholderia cepacia]MCW3498687.1 hypothetical protein [Burkholderia cenocepacia]MCW3506225.1 hypothetical protein [Burkholderia cenocepacia]
MRLKEKEIQVVVQQIEVKEMVITVKATTRVAAGNAAMHILTNDKKTQKQLASQTVKTQRYQLA